MGWWLEHVRCPVSGDELMLEEGSLEGGILRAKDAVVRYPVIAGVPFLVPNVEEYLARHRESVLAALAEVGLATESAVRRVLDLSASIRSNAARFEDDWTETEVDDAAPRFTVPDGEVGAHLGELISITRQRGAEARLRALLAEGPAPKLSIELGIGAGQLTRALSEVSKHVLAIDISPRAALRARGLPNVAPVVMDAEALALAPSIADLIVAANLIDLLDGPLGFLTAAAEALAPEGNLVLTTPDPWPWEGESSLAAAVFEHAGLRLDTFEDGLPWLRDHGSRELQVYLVQLIKAHRSAK